MNKTTLIDNKTLMTDTISARFKTRIGETKEHKKHIMLLIDKGVYKIDYCPICKSTNTYHKRMMNVNHKQSIHYDNVWKTESLEKCNGLIFIKKDYCYNCQKEFIIEFYVWYYIGKIKLIKRIKNKLNEWLKK